jgi:hypothetical protein
LITLPEEMRDRAWVPSGPSTMMFEYDASEANLWTQEAYDEEFILEADAE